jgi:hypothetical protein
MSDRAIESSLILRTAFRLALRRAVGFMKSVLNFESVLRRCMNEGLVGGEGFRCRLRRPRSSKPVIRKRPPGGAHE